MNKAFHSAAAPELQSFLQFKRRLGYRYKRAEFSLREFDRFLVEYAGKNADCQHEKAEEGAESVDGDPHRATATRQRQHADRTRQGAWRLP